MAPLQNIVNKLFKKTHLAKGILHNKYVLYFVFLVTILNLFYQTVKQDYLYCALFVLIGFVTAFFNKNMIVILVITLATTALIRVIIRGGGDSMEGFKQGDDQEEDNAPPAAPSDAAAPSAATPPTPTVPETADSNAPPPKIGDNLSKNSGGAAGAALTKTDLVNQMKSNAVELMTVQHDIISGFQTIEPHMERAEALIESIQGTAKTIQGMKTQEQLTAKSGFKSN